MWILPEFQSAVEITAYRWSHHMKSILGSHITQVFPRSQRTEKNVYHVYCSSILHGSGFIKFELWFILAKWPKWSVRICPKLSAFLFQNHACIQNQMQTRTGTDTHLLVTQNQAPTSSSICIQAGIRGTTPAASLMWSSTFTTLSPD